MNRGMYIAGTSMLTNRQRMDVIANNIANATTNGFKQDTFVSRSFDDMLISATNEDNIVNKTREVGPLNTGIHVDAVYTNFTTGAITATDVETDLAIEGNGFFVLRTPQGERYTRDGSFRLDAQGYLVNQDGYSVLGENGEIFVGNSELKIALDGTVFVDGNRVDTIRVANAEDLNSLRKDGNNLYNGNMTNIRDGFNIRQNALESSNTDVITGVVDMMKVYRNYESSQKVIQTIDSTLGKAVDLGKV